MSMWTVYSGWPVRPMTSSLQHSSPFVAYSVRDTTNHDDMDCRQTQNSSGVDRPDGDRSYPMHIDTIDHFRSFDYDAGIDHDQESGYHDFRSISCSAVPTYTCSYAMVLDGSNELNYGTIPYIVVGKVPTYGSCPICWRRRRDNRSKQWWRVQRLPPHLHVPEDLLESHLDRHELDDWRISYDLDVFLYI